MASQGMTKPTFRQGPSRSLTVQTYWASMRKFLSLQQNSRLKGATSNMTFLLLLFILILVALLIRASVVASPTRLLLKEGKKQKQNCKLQPL